MAKKTKVRSWPKDDVQMLTTLAREKTKTTVIARKLKRTLGATKQKAMRLAVTLGEDARGRGRGKVADVHTCELCALHDLAVNPF
jgi:hypothetical protein